MFNLPQTMRARYRLAVLFGVVAMLAVWLLGSCEPQRSTQRRADEGRLPRLGIELGQTTVSGISSGAYMAGQFHLAHSRIVTGAAIIAGGPFGCAESVLADAAGGGATAFNAVKAVNGCMLNLMAIWGVPDVEALARRAEAMAQSGVIDPLDAARRGRIYLFSGTEDVIVRPAIVEAARRFYLRLGFDDAAVKFVSTVPAGHAFITEAQGGACGRSASPFIADCDYDQAGSLLAHLLGPLQPPVTEPAGELTAFAQQPYLDGLPEASMAEAGMIYVPPLCRADNARCRVHVAFHGCAQNRAKVGEAFVRHTGFLRWAEANRLVVLFPEVTSGPGNPQGCWDWWGYSGRRFLEREAPQIVAVRRMLDALASR